MNFEDHFLPNDIAVAKLTFGTIVTSLKLIDSYSRKGEHDNAARASKELTTALMDLNELASRKSHSNDMYLHHLLSHPQGWYPA